jgi:transaldolase
MKLFIDSANVDHIKELNDLGILSGVTTNPTLMAKEGKDVNETLISIAKMVNGPISGEVISTDAQGMIEEGKKIAALHPNMIVKVPMTEAGIQATKAFTELGIKTNVTLIFSVSQALLACTVGATYISPFVGRLDDIGVSGISLVEEIRDMIDVYGFDTEIISASIRHAEHIRLSAQAGAHIATIPYPVLKKAFNHPLTDSGLAAFIADHKKVYGG